MCGVYAKDAAQESQRIQGSGFRVQVLGFRVQGLGFRVQGSGLIVVPQPCSMPLLGLL